MLDWKSSLVTCIVRVLESNSGALLVNGRAWAFGCTCGAVSAQGGYCCRDAAVRFIWCLVSVQCCICDMHYNQQQWRARQDTGLGFPLPVTCESVTDRV